jgi:sugar O-acyltransferase (sialic acid O-acetyltransferase NeuD family)
MSSVFNEMPTDSPRKLVIFGTAGMAQVVYACVQTDPTRHVVAFTVDRRYISEDRYEGLPLIPFDEIETRCPPASHGLLVAVGQGDRNRLRARVFDAALAKGYDVESYIDPSVRTYPSNRIGRGCLVFDGVSLQPYAQIGDNVVIRPLAYIGHHAVIEAHCFVAPHAAILGRCRIGEFGFIGTHATLSSRVTLGRHSFVSAGAVVTLDMPAYSIIRGPAANSTGRRG